MSFDNELSASGADGSGKDYTTRIVQTAVVEPRHRIAVGYGSRVEPSIINCH